MIRLGCVLARVGDVALPPWLLDDPERIANAFRQASGGDIDLRLDPRRLTGLPLSGRPVVDALSLHDATAALTGNHPSRPIQSIAVLFAGAYAYGAGSILGIMFDEGFATPDDRSARSALHVQPREGCAVFLDTIRSWRPGADDFAAESEFTTLHEMGHLFNLQHVRSECFLAEPRAGGPFEQAYWRFTDRQKFALSQCSRSDFVRPGGARFGDGDPFGVASRISTSRAPPRHLELQLEPATRRFWPFEPIEMDIVLRVPPAAERGVRVLDRIDPGHDQFRLWIEEPSGERRLYRSPRRYCALPSRRALKPGEVFRRDISVFGQAGGFTFKSAGLHTLWAEFEVRAGAWLSSPKVEIEIAPAEASEFYTEARTVLSTPSARGLLYHRVVRPGMRIAKLHDFVQHHGDWAGVGRVQYGLGQALLRNGLGRSGEAAKARVALGRDLLERSVDRDGLGYHQRGKAAQMLDALGQA